MDSGAGAESARMPPAARAAGGKKVSVNGQSKNGHLARLLHSSVFEECSRPKAQDTSVPIILKRNALSKVFHGMRDTETASCNYDKFNELLNDLKMIHMVNSAEDTGELPTTREELVVRYAASVKWLADIAGDTSFLDSQDIAELFAHNEICKMEAESFGYKDDYYGPEISDVATRMILLFAPIEKKTPEAFTEAMRRDLVKNPLHKLCNLVIDYFLWKQPNRWREQIETQVAIAIGLEETPEAFKPGEIYHLARKYYIDMKCLLHMHDRVMRRFLAENPAVCAFDIEKKVAVAIGLKKVDESDVYDKLSSKADEYYKQVFKEDHTRLGYTKNYVLHCPKRHFSDEHAANLARDWYGSYADEQPMEATPEDQIAVGSFVPKEGGSECNKPSIGASTYDRNTLGKHTCSQCGLKHSSRVMRLSSLMKIAQNNCPGVDPKKVMATVARMVTHNEEEVVRCVAVCASPVCQVRALINTEEEWDKYLKETPSGNGHDGPQLNKNIEQNVEDEIAMVRDLQQSGEINPGESLALVNFMAKWSPWIGQRERELLVYLEYLTGAKAHLFGYVIYDKDMFKGLVRKFWCNFFRKKAIDIINIQQDNWKKQLTSYFGSNGPRRPSESEVAFAATRWIHWISTSKPVDKNGKPVLVVSRHARKAAWNALTAKKFVDMLRHVAKAGYQDGVKIFGQSFQSTIGGLTSWQIISSTTVGLAHFQMHEMRRMLENGDSRVKGYNVLHPNIRDVNDNTNSIERNTRPKDRHTIIARCFDLNEDEATQYMNLMFTKHKKGPPKSAANLTGNPCHFEDGKQTPDIDGDVAAGLEFTQPVYDDEVLEWTDASRTWRTTLSNRIMARHDSARIQSVKTTSKRKQHDMEDMLLSIHKEKVLFEAEHLVTLLTDDKHAKLRELLQCKEAVQGKKEIIAAANYVRDVAVWKTMFQSDNPFCKQHKATLDTLMGHIDVLDRARREWTVDALNSSKNQRMITSDPLAHPKSSAWKWSEVFRPCKAMEENLRHFSPDERRCYDLLKWKTIMKRHPYPFPEKMQTELKELQSKLEEKEKELESKRDNEKNNRKRELGCCEGAGVQHLQESAIFAALKRLSQAVRKYLHLAHETPDKKRTNMPKALQHVEGHTLSSKDALEKLERREDLWENEERLSELMSTQGFLTLEELAKEAAVTPFDIYNKLRIDKKTAQQAKEFFGTLEELEKIGCRMIADAHDRFPLLKTIRKEFIDYMLFLTNRGRMEKSGALEKMAPEAQQEHNELLEYTKNMEAAIKRFKKKKLNSDDKHDRYVLRCWETEVAAAAGSNADQYNGSKVFAQQLAIFRHRRLPSMHFQCDKLPKGAVDEAKLALMDKRCAKVGSKRKYTPPLSRGKLSDELLTTYTNKRRAAYREDLGTRDDDMESPAPDTIAVTKKRKNNSKNDAAKRPKQNTERTDALWAQLSALDASD